MLFVIRDKKLSSLNDQAEEREDADSTTPLLQGAHSETAWVGMPAVVKDTTHLPTTIKLKDRSARMTKILKKLLSVDYGDLRAMHRQKS